MKMKYDVMCRCMKELATTDSGVTLTSGNVFASMQEFGYAGMQYEADADIYLTPNRAYSQALGRWLSPDPLGTMPNAKTGNRFSPLAQYTDGLNLYAYCNNDPVNGLDVMGLNIMTYDSYNPWNDNDPWNPLGGCIESRNDKCVGMCDSSDFVLHFINPFTQGEPFFLDDEYINSFLKLDGAQAGVADLNSQLRLLINEADVSCENNKVDLRGRISSFASAPSGFNRYSNPFDQFYSIGQTTLTLKYNCNVSVACKCCKSGMKIVKRQGNCRISIGISDSFTNVFDIGGTDEKGHDGWFKDYPIRGNTVQSFNYCKEYSCD